MSESIAPANMDPSATPAQAIRPPTTSQKVSENYLGNPLLTANLSADIPANLSCSLWLLNLPEDVTVKELLRPIRGYGRVFATVINPPSKDAGHMGAAAKIIFFELRAAQAMFHDSKSNPSLFTIRNMVPLINMNRIRTAESNLPISHSRVLIIRGPKDLVNNDRLTAFFMEKGITWEMETMITHGNTVPGHTTQEWRFGSYRAQAIAAYLKLKGSEVHVKAGVKVDFGVDPCWIPIPGVGMYREKGEKRMVTEKVNGGLLLNVASEDGY